MIKKMLFRNRPLQFAFMILVIFTNYSEASQESNIPAKYVNDFKDELKLSEAQIEKFNEILGIYNSQSIIDKETFGTNPIALVEAGKRRMNVFDMGMNSFLNDVQRAHYLVVKKDNRNENELFILKEGLLLTNSQTLHAGFILEEYNARLDLIRESKQGMRKKSDRTELTAKGSGRGGKGGGRGGMQGGGGKKGGNPGEEIDFLISAKSKRIKAILTESQKKYYKQLKKYFEEIRSTERSKKMGRFN